MGKWVASWRYVTTVIKQVCNPSKKANSAIPVPQEKTADVAFAVRHRNQRKFDEQDSVMPPVS
jgi:hypothetical protein